MPQPAVEQVSFASDTPVQPVADPLVAGISGQADVPAPVAADSALVFHVQLLVSGKQLSATDAVFKGVGGIECLQEDGFYKYVTGRTTDVDEAFRSRNALLAKFPDAFLTAHKAGKKVPVQEAIRQARNQQK